jgi:hypothetical protein
MATYINGVTDYIPQIQSFQPDLNFYGNVMQTRQGKYDAGKKKVSDLYGSLLYAPMSRDTNIKRRDEFFKVIDNDIKRISGMDLSLEQNQDAAMGVFKGFYDDKFMINDMVKTKNYQSQVQRGENFKYCTDTEKCGGQYWDAGMQKLQYKMDEFKKVSDDESMNFSMGEFDPYFDWKDKASKKAKELGYEVKQDTPSGRWIIHDVNGKLVEGGLYNLFTSLYGDDPRVQSNYDTQAYVTRKNFAKGNALQFGSEDEAEKQYIMKNINQGLSDANSNMKVINDSYNQLNSSFNKLDKKNNGVGLTPQEKAAYEAIIAQKGQLEKSKSTLQSRIDNIQNNIDMNDIDSLRRRADLGAATSFEQSDMLGLAESLANIKKERTLTVNPYTKMYEEFGLQKKLADHNALLDVWKMKHKFNYDFKLEEAKGAIKTNQLPTEGYSITGAPWANVKYDLDAKPSLAYDANMAERNLKQQEASAKSSVALYQLYEAAKAAYNSDPNKNAGAEQFLKQFGTKYTIGSPQELQKAIIDNKLTAISAFNGVVSNASMKNNPTGDYSWARPILNQKGGVIDDVKFANEAFHSSLNADLKTNKRIADKIAGTLSAENPVARHAKSLITENGFLRDEASFIKDYKATNLKSHIVVSDDDGKNAYKKLTEQFFNTYNAAEETSLRQGAGLPGLGMTTSTPKSFVGLDILKKGSDKVVTDIIKTTNEALSNFATTTVAIGDPSKATLEQGNNEDVANFATWYLNHQSEMSDKSQNRTFTGMVSNIAAEDPTKAAITFKSIDPDVIKQYKAVNPETKLQDLSKGFTVFFDKSKQANPFEKPMSNLETVLRLDGHAKSTGYQDNAGTVDWVFDKSSNKVQAIWTPSQYNEKYQWIDGEPEVLVDTDMANIGDKQAFVDAKLSIWAAKQQAIGQQIAKFNQAKKK